MSSKRSLDIVVSGPDMSGTSTQVGDIISYFEDRGLKVRDLRWGELDALFHAEAFKDLNRDFRSLREYEQAVKKGRVGSEDDLNRFYESARQLPRASSVRNEVSTYIDPESADVWVMEEPSKRGLVRMVDMHMSQFWASHDPFAQAFSYGDDRYHEFFRFRQAFRQSGRIIVRSRSEESATYQIEDAERLPNGISIDEYLQVPGNAKAVQHPPSLIFAVHAPVDWSEDEYKELKRQRETGRIPDDHELNVPYQLLVNRRYASNWLQEFYEHADEVFGGGVPRIAAIPMYGKDRKPVEKEPIRTAIYNVLDVLPELKDRA
ncbi:hypothetical protein KY327_02970 [Candidatus Woesearchaeota archaeon]|nr:hypothetical protein [Candidatus Woesearchaeota archaeon]